jgi:TatA/E family protein of Tat protein translocase
MSFLHCVHLGLWNLGPTEIIVILVIAVILFGGRLPEVARTLGKGFFEFKKNLRDLQDDIYRHDVGPPKNLPKPYYKADDFPKDEEPADQEKTKLPTPPERKDSSGDQPDNQD